ncbi:MAG: pyridoxal-phosphate dependent enzyme [Halieaceae bacterium]|jgi:1-aminocyclopropane-1-carboxylate deaminase/D-cysteine desulfhydrase-like pyridoxal-dependent ACC family enzyme|nr:pyridoxal-phosphate dependent enzyme [Halieaceae bacterium]
MPHSHIANRPLFIRYPELAAQLPIVNVADLPTPVENLHRISGHAWIKRDDISHPEYGGNKVRKLEFLLPEIFAAKATKVVTIGAVGTNSGVAAAMICRKFGLACEIITFDQPASSTVAHNLKLMNYYDADLVYRNSPLRSALQFYIHPGRLQPKTHFLFAGCTSPTSVFGYVNAIFELKEQIDLGLCPLPRTIVVATGSGATTAGLMLGCALAQLPIHIKAIQVAPAFVGPVPVCHPAYIARLISAATAILSRSYPQYKSLRLPEPKLDSQYYGGTYGGKTEAGVRAVEFAAKKAGLALEQTYTGKAFAAFLDELDASPEPCMFWHTYNSQDTAALIARSETTALASPFQHYL